MKPELKTETVEITYWSCGFPGHRHRTEEAAAACMTKRNSAAGIGVTIRWTEDKCAKVLADHRAGAKLCDIAKEHGISATSARYVITKAKRFEKKAADLL